MWHRTLALLTPTHPPTCAERPDFTDAIILRKGASVEHVVSETCQGWGAPPVPSGSCLMSSGPSANPQPRAVRQWTCIPPPGCSRAWSNANGLGTGSLLVQGHLGSSGCHCPVTPELPGPWGPPDIQSGRLPAWAIPDGSFQVVYPKCWPFFVPPTPRG